MQSFAFNWLSSIFVTANKHCGCNDLDFLPLAWSLPLLNPSYIVARTRPQLYYVVFILGQINN
jgi:hypothetical protein